MENKQNIRKTCKLNEGQPSWVESKFQDRLESSLPVSDELPVTYALAKSVLSIGKCRVETLISVSY